MIYPSAKLTLETTLKAFAGYAIGAVTQTNQILWATILATQSIANFVLVQIAKSRLTSQFSVKTIKDYSSAASYLAATVLLYQTGLISLRVAGLFGFFDLAFLLGRIKWFKMA